MSQRPIQRTRTIALLLASLLGLQMAALALHAHPVAPTHDSFSVVETGPASQVPTATLESDCDLCSAPVQVAGLRLIAGTLHESSRAWGLEFPTHWLPRGPDASAHGPRAPPIAS